MRNPSLTRRMVKVSLAFLALVITLLSVHSVAGQQTTYLMLRFDAGGNTVSGVQLWVIEETMFQMDTLFVGDTPQDAGFSWRLSDDDGSVLITGVAYPSFNNRLEFNPAAARLEILKDGLVVHSQHLSFCDNDGVCEPCGNRGPDDACRLLENTLTCADCPSGGEDEYCDLLEDGICDPDCNGVDLDCPGCAPEECYYHDSDILPVRCEEDLGGEVCQPRVDCTGRFVYADDSGTRCCVKGVCGHGPSLPSDCSEIGGEFCGSVEQCTGIVAFTHHTGYVCCVGGECAAEGDAEDAGDGGTLPQDVFESKTFLAVLVILEVLLLILVVIMLRKGRKRR